MVPVVVLEDVEYLIVASDEIYDPFSGALSTPYVNVVEVTPEIEYDPAYTLSETSILLWLTIF